MANINDKDERYISNARIDEMIEVVVRVARGDFSARVTLSAENDAYDSLAMGINMMTDDLRFLLAQLKAKIDEKEIMLKEIHHRVKNNMAIISGLISLQLRQTTNREAIESLVEIKNRITTMALVHETLYRADDLASISMPVYIAKILGLIQSSLTMPGDKIAINQTIAPVSFDLGIAIPFGLIVNEVLTNCYEHAYPRLRTGEIKVILSCSDDQEFLLSIADDGVGLAETFDIKKSQTTGMMIIDALAHQLGGTCLFENRAGTCFTMKFRG